MAKSESGETIIAEGVKVEGDFTSNGNVTIAGTVSGNVAAEGNIYITETAVIDADVSAQSATISGRVKGNVRIDETTELTETSNIKGDLETRVLAIAAGAQVNGRIIMPDGAGQLAEEDEYIEE